MKKHICAIALLAGISGAVTKDFAALAHYQAHRPVEINLSESDIARRAGLRYVESLRKKYGLKVGFTAKDYGDAYAEKEVMELRREYLLGPDFTSDQLAANAGATSILRKMKVYGLKSGFTEGDVRQALVKEELSSISGRRGLTRGVPFSHSEYAQLEGENEAHRLIEYKGLPVGFTYQDLVNRLGYREAGYMRRKYGFSKSASHAEIILAIGKVEADRLAERYDLPANFSAMQLLDGVTSAVNIGKGMFTKSDYEFFTRDLLAGYTDADLIAREGKLRVAHLAREYGLPSLTFTEKELREAVSRQGILEETRRFDFDNSNWVEADLYVAHGDDAAISIRSACNLYPGFRAEDSKNAVRRDGKSQADDYALPRWSACGAMLEVYLP